MHYPERDPRETGLCSMSLVHTLADLGVPRRHVLMMSEQQATILFAHLVKDRLIDAAIRKAVHYA